MIIDVNLCNSTTNDLAIVIDLLRASTTITVALESFKKVIPVNNLEKAFELKEKYDAILAGEKKAEKIKGFDLSNSPVLVQNYPDNDILILRTTNGTKVLEKIKQSNPNTTVLIGTAINARAVAKEALKLAKDEIELVMAGRHEKFTMEDCVGAGLIINEMIKIAKDENISLELSDSAKIAQYISQDYDKVEEFITTSASANRIRELKSEEDIELSKNINSSKIVPIYENNEITVLNN